MAAIRCKCIEICSRYNLTNQTAYDYISRKWTSTWIECGKPHFCHIHKKTVPCNQPPNWNLPALAPPTTPSSLQLRNNSTPDSRTAIEAISEAISLLSYACANQDLRDEVTKRLLFTGKNDMTYHLYSAITQKAVYKEHKQEMLFQLRTTEEPVCARCSIRNKRRAMQLVTSPAEPKPARRSPKTYRSQGRVLTEQGILDLDSTPPRAASPTTATLTTTIALLEAKTIILRQKLAIERIQKRALSEKIVTSSLLSSPNSPQARLGEDYQLRTHVPPPPKTPSPSPSSLLFSFSLLCAVMGLLMTYRVMESMVRYGLWMGELLWEMEKSVWKDAYGQ